MRKKKGRVQGVVCAEGRKILIRNVSQRREDFSLGQGFRHGHMVLQWGRPGALDGCSCHFIVCRTDLGLADELWRPDSGPLIRPLSPANASANSRRVRACQLQNLPESCGLPSPVGVSVAIMPPTKPTWRFRDGQSKKQKRRRERRGQERNDG